MEFVKILSLSSSVKRWSKSEKFIKKLPDLGIFWTRKKQMLNVFYLFTRTLNYINEDKHLAHNYDEVCCVIHLYDVFQNWNLAVLLKILSNFTFKYREWTWISGFRRNVDYRRNKCRFTNIQSALQLISGIISKRYSRTKCYGRLSGSQSVSKYNDFTEAKIERLVTIGTACNCSFFYSFPRKQQLDNHPVPLKHIPAEAE